MEQNCTRKYLESKVSESHCLFHATRFMLNICTDRVRRLLHFFETIDGYPSKDSSTMPFVSCRDAYRHCCLTTHTFAMRSRFSFNTKLFVDMNMTVAPHHSTAHPSIWVWWWWWSIRQRSAPAANRVRSRWVRRRVAATDKPLTLLVDEPRNMATARYTIIIHQNVLWHILYNGKLWSEIYYIYIYTYILFIKHVLWPPQHLLCRAEQNAQGGMLWFFLLPHHHHQLSSSSSSCGDVNLINDFIVTGRSEFAWRLLLRYEAQCAHARSQTYIYP